jgi:hypothetical protein
MTPEELFVAAELSPVGSVGWGTAIPDHGAGVYVISVDDAASVCLDELPALERSRWLKDEPIIYIGRARKLSGRLSQLYQHKYGNKAPHRGGQSILLVGAAKRVHWAPARDYAGTERRLIEAFVARVGHRPFGNRMSGQRAAGVDLVRR